MAKTYLTVTLVLAVVYWSTMQSSASSRPRNSRKGQSSAAGFSMAFLVSRLGGRAHHEADSRSILLGRAALWRRYLPATDSLLVFGPTRSGKTMTLALPVLVGFRGPAVVTSVKRDLYQRSVESRQRQGECHIFDLSDPGSSPWNLFSLISDFRSAKEVSDHLCGVTRSKSAELDFWSQLGSKMLAPLLLAGKESGRSLLGIVEWIESQDFEAAFEVLSDTCQLEARNALDAVLHLDNRAVSSVIATLLSLLAPFNDPAISDLLSHDGIDLPRILDRSRSNTLYICSPLFRAERFFGIYEIFLRKIFEMSYQNGSADPRILFLLDELANIAPISDLDKIASTCGGYGIVLVSIFQDLTQLGGIYGSHGGTIVNNHRSKLCLSGITDHTTLDYVEKVISHRNGGTAQRDANPLLSLARGYGLLLQANSRPQRLRLRHFPR
ncbi:MAG: hypothetical protein EPN30_10575 [Actinomycetota bacterium]|nr:MAG: hypothetical protein EPN30_10575 [Actinomycetota bacterium]